MGRLLSDQVSQRPEVEVEIVVLEAELGLQFLHPVSQQHERLAEPLDLVVGERPALDPTESLALHQLAKQVDQRQHEPCEALLELLRFGVHSPGEGGVEAIELVTEQAQVAVDGVHEPALLPAKLYGGQGPVHVNDSAVSSRSSSSTRARN